MIVAMEKKLAGCVLAAVLLLLTALPVHAAGSPQIVELKLKEDQLLACVKNAGSGEVAATLGKTPAEVIASQTLQEADMEIRTLILIDNSLSIPEELRPTVQDRLLELVAARRENEYFSLGTISDHVTILVDFTRDYMQIKSALESLEYQYQDTFLTDALYDYMAVDPFRGYENSFERILLVADGVDNKSLGYTKSELLTVLKDFPLPIYTLGLQYGSKANDEELENLFALARAANGETILLNNSTDDASDLTAILDGDWNNLAVTVKIPESVQDGSLQTLTIRFGEEGPLASMDNIRMPLQEEKPREQTPPAIEPEPKPEPQPQPETKEPLPIVPLLLIGGVLLLVIILLVILLRRKKKAPETGTDERTPEPMKQTPAPLTSKTPPIERKTEKLGGAAESYGGDGSKTVRLWNQKPACVVTLEDIRNPGRIYQKTIEQSLTIGANPDSDICVDYDRTVSRRQCEIFLEDGELYLINRSQSNLTELRGQIVNQKTRLASGDTIKMGLVEMRITFQLSGPGLS